MIKNISRVEKSSVKSNKQLKYSDFLHKKQLFPNILKILSFCIYLYIFCQAFLYVDELRKYNKKNMVNIIQAIPISSIL